MSYKSLYFPILKRRSKYSNYRRYTDYRQEIRVDCQGRCAYCDIHENELGGSEFMTLDHFRPKDKYAHLKHEPTNLLWCCTKCNNLKDNYWPAYGIAGTVVQNRGFIDPFVENFNDYFEVLPNGEFKAIKVPANYMIKILYLNRAGAKRVRELRNQKYERKKHFQYYYELAMKDIDSWLTSPNLSTEEKEKILQHQKYVEEYHKVGMQDSESDFKIY